MLNKHTEKLINLYRFKLNDYARLNNDSNDNLFFMGKKIKDDYYLNIFNSFWGLLQRKGKPIYISRQYFINDLFLDNKMNTHYNVNTTSDSETCGYSESKDDPYHNTNYGIAKYEINGKSYCRIKSNLKSRFFEGEDNYHSAGYKNKKNYLYSVSLEHISIADFEALFTPPIDIDYEDFIKSPSFKSRFNDFIKKSISIEKSDFKDIDFIKPESEISNDKSFQRNLERRNNCIFIDKNNNEILEYFTGVYYDTCLSIGDIIEFETGFKIITNIQIENKNDIGNYSVLTFEDYIE